MDNNLNLRLWVERITNPLCFALPDKLVKQRSTGSTSRSAPLTWVDVLSLPLPAIKDQGHTKTDEEEEQHR